MLVVNTGMQQSSYHAPQLHNNPTITMTIIWLETLQPKQIEHCKKMLEYPLHYWQEWHDGITAYLQEAH